MAIVINGDGSVWRRTVDDEDRSMKTIKPGYHCREEAVQFSIWAGLLTETKQYYKRSLTNKAHHAKD